MILHPGLDAAFIGQIVEHLGGLPFPAAVEHNDVHMAVAGFVALLAGVAVNKSGGARRIVVVDDSPD